MAAPHIRRSQRSSRRGVERRALYALLVMAWAWILGFLGVVIWHMRKQKAAGEGTTQNNPTAAAQGGVTKPNIQMIGFLPAVEKQKSAKANLPKPTKQHAYDSPLLIFTCKRANYLSETLEDIYKNIPRPCRFGCPIVVSEDGQHGDVQKVILDYKAKFEAQGIPFFHIQHKSDFRGGTAYHALAQHYKWALSQVFDGKIDPMLPLPQRVVILEEDIHTAPDFFSYMEATSKILDEDSSLFAVSAFNDNGHMVNDPKRLLRSDFFPGLGWMMTRKLWSKELESKWPSSYWDDWLREPAQRKGRQVIRPEFSRTYHFGSKGGASKNQFGNILEQVKLNHEFIDWSKEDLSYLREPAYDEWYGKFLQASKHVSTIEEAIKAVQTENAWVEYRDFQQFQQFAQRLNIMDDEKAMIPRTAYKGVVETRPHGQHLLFLTPPIQELREDFRFGSVG